MIRVMSLLLCLSLSVFAYAADNMDKQQESQKEVHATKLDKAKADKENADSQKPKAESADNYGDFPFGSGGS